VYSLDVNGYAYLDNLREFAEMRDINEGLIKGLVFGYIISAIGTFIGYNTRGGAKGVGQSTTKAVVFSSVSVFVADYVLSAFFLVF
jgi:phospholipid/cholesterol/gamma-HCH transport system permease protein